MTLKRALQALFALVLLALLWATTRASLDKNVLQAYVDLGGDKWGLATLFDAYFGFIAFFAWVAYKEPRWMGRLGWFVALMALGNFAIAAYALIELAHWDPASGASGLLLRRKRAYEPEFHWDDEGGRKRRKKRRRSRGGKGGGGSDSQPFERERAASFEPEPDRSNAPAQRHDAAGGHAPFDRAPKPRAERNEAPRQAPKPAAPPRAQAQPQSQPKQQGGGKGGGKGGRRDRKGGGSNSRNPFFVEDELPRRPERRQRTRDERPKFSRRLAGDGTLNPPEPGERG